ncbi:hypothetical protein [Lacipirellula limnantheis]|uniref:Uncharacterized protein n=1 Tax=Lacipirellula limnantheis TaxID=2528024 RepID=A0A517U5A7_9BACT|nr:hypothetical protein [Lacipirellula limnantheis]QDT75824.1 hypothetical protein I41_50670 [Lacipirellula limnantheis]
MRTHLTRWMAACGLVVAVLTAPFAVAQSAGEAKPVAVVAFAGYDELMKDLNFVGELGDHKGASDMIEQFVQMFTQGKGLAGFDKTKPIGAIIQTDGQMPSGAICLPVSDVNALLDVAKGFGVTVTDMGDGVSQIRTPQGAGAFLKKSGNWALLSMAPTMFEGLPEDPADAFAPLVKQYDVAVNVLVKNLPEAYRQQAIDAMSQGAQARGAKESDEEYAARQKAFEAQLAQMKEFINDLDAVTVGVKVDNDKHNAVFDFVYTALPGTKLAKQIADNSKVTTNFAGFSKPEAAMNVTFASATSGADVSQVQQMIETARAKGNAAIEKTSKIEEGSKAKAKEALEDFLTAFQKTLEGGVTDGGASLELGDNSMSFVAGAYVVDSAKVLEGIKKYAELETTDLPKVELDAETIGDVKFHNVTYKIPADDEKAKKLLTENGEMIVGVGKNAVYFAMGADPVAAVKAAIAASAKSPKKAIMPFEMTIGLQQALEFAKSVAEEDQKPLIENLSEAVSSASSGSDHIRLVGEPVKNGIRTRLELQEGVLKAIGKGASQARMQGAGAPAGF